LCLRGEYLTSNRKETDVSEDFEIEEERDEKGRGEGFEEKWQRDPIGAATGGLVLILIGLVLFAANQGWVQWGDFWAYFLVGLGLIFLVETAIRFAMPEYRRPVGGRLVVALVLIAVGLGGIFGFTRLWPLILIAIGLGILIRGLLRRG